MAYNATFVQQSFTGQFDTLMPELPAHAEELSENLLRTLDPTTLAGQRLIANMALSGADGSISGVSTGGAHNTEDDTPEKRRERASVIYEALMLDQQRQMIQGRINDLEAENERLDAEYTALLDEERQLATDVTAVRANLTINTQNLQEVERNLARTHAQIVTATQDVVAGIPGARGHLDKITQGEEVLVTIHARLPGENTNAIAQGYAVYRDQDNRFYIQDRAGRRFDLEQLRSPYQKPGCEFDFRRDIEIQLATGHRLGTANDPQVARHNQGYSGFMAALRGHPERLALANAYETVREEQRFYEIRQHELQLERQQLEHRIADLDARMETNRNGQRINRETHEANRQEIEGLRTQLASIDERFNNLSARSGAAREIVERISTFSQRFQEAARNGSISPEERASLAQGLPPSIATQLLSAYETARQTRIVADNSQEIADEIQRNLSSVRDRHAQIRERYSADMGSLEKWAMHRPDWFVNSAGAHALAWLHPDYAIVKAWNNVIKTSDGQAVYRENIANGNFYTYNERTRTRTVITDQQELLRITRAYGRGDLLANESPFASKDPDNQFDTRHAQSLISADDIRASQEAAAARAREAAEAEAAAQRLAQTVSGQPAPDTTRHFISAAARPAASAQASGGDTNRWAPSHASTFLSVAANPAQIDSPNTAGPAVIPATRT